MNKVLTSSGLIAGLLLLLFMASCSKDNNIEETIIPPQEEVVPDLSSTKIYVEAQTTMLQFLTTVATETIINSSPLFSASSPCPEVVHEDDCGGPGSNGERLTITYADCEDDYNGLGIDGEIVITNCKSNLNKSTPKDPGCIELTNNKIRVAHCDIEIIGSSTKISFYAKDLNSASTDFIFAIEEGTQFKITNLNTFEETLITPSRGENGCFLELNPKIDLTTLDLYNTRYKGTFKQNSSSDPMWKVVVTPFTGPTKEFRVTTTDPIRFRPSFAYIYNGNILCYTAPDKDGKQKLSEDWEFGSDEKGCNEGKKDSFAEICTIINPDDCVISSDCSVVDMQ